MLHEVAAGGTAHAPRRNGCGLRRGGWCMGIGVLRGELGAQRIRHSIGCHRLFGRRAAPPTIDSARQRPKQSLPEARPPPAATLAC